MSIAQKLTVIAENEQKVYDAGVDSGKQAEYEEFFENYTAKTFDASYTGVQASFLFAGPGWNDKTFRPTKDIKVGKKNANSMFAQSRITDLEAILEEKGVVLDLSEAVRVDQIFTYCTYLEKVPVLDFSKATVIAFTAIFNECRALHTIRKLILPVNNLNSNSLYSSAFANCNSLVNIEVEGLIVKNISFSVSPLSIESLKSIISHLADYAGTDSEYTYTITFLTSAFQALEAEGATAEYDGTACTWAELIDNKKWNLTLA